MRLVSGAILHQDPGRAYYLDVEADALEKILHQEQEEEDRRDAYMECRYQEWLAEQAKFTDRDLERAGLPVG